MSLVILVGASGAGKTTIANAIESRLADRVRVFHFDSIGVPTAEHMVREYGSAEAWQRAKTIEWMGRLSELDGQRVLLEGQTRLSFLAEGAVSAGGLSYYPVLVDCSDADRSRRLSLDRQQPELTNADMMNWAAYLRREAMDRGCTTLDTSQLSLEQAVSFVMNRLG